MAKALQCYSADNVDIHCSTLSSGPFGIESQADTDSVAVPMRDLVAADKDSSAFVIACYSDPGLAMCREATDKPVFGIAESGLLTALSRGQQTGVIAIARPSIKRHQRYMRQMGILDRCAGERALDMTVAETESGEHTLQKMIRIGEQLRDDDGADVIVMGCAGMARHRTPLEQALQIPVIDPTQAAVGMALTTVLAS